MARGIAATWLLLSVALCQAIVLPEASHPGRTTPAARSPQTRSLRIVRSYKPRSNRPAGREVGRYGFATSKFRQGYLLDAKPLEVLVSLEGPVQCLVACLFRFPRCKAFNFGDRTCKLLESFLCDPAMPDVRLQRDEMSRYYDVMTSQEIRATQGALPNCSSTLEESGDYSTTPTNISSETEATESDIMEGSTRGTDSPSSVAPEPKFLLRLTLRTFMDSFRSCAAEGLTMAMPVTADDHKALVKLMLQNKVARLWIGVQRTMDGNTTFLSGDQVPQTSRRWGKGQPNNSGGTQICVEMIDVLAYLWNDYDCENPAAYACQHTSSAGPH